LNFTDGMIKMINILTSLMICMMIMFWIMILKN